jgi:glycosyltransferase 2 family protein
LAALSGKTAWLSRLAAVVALTVFAGFLGLAVRSIAGGLTLQSVHLAPIVVVSILPLAVWSFGLRLIRLHVLLRRVVPGLTLPLTLRTQTIGFALAVSPGRLAEFYKLRAVQQATGVSVATGLPAVLAERLTDLSAFAALVLVGGWLSWSGTDDARRAAGWLILGLAVIGGAFVYQIGARRGLERLQLEGVGRLRRWKDLLVTRFPLVAAPLAILRQLRAGSIQLASPSVLGTALGAVVAARVGDVLVIYLVSRALGYPIAFTTAMLMLGLTGLAGGISLAPGGMGAAEAALTALAVAQGIPLDAAVTIALVTRALTFWIWVVVGLVVFATSLLGDLRRRPEQVAAGVRARD